MPRRDADRRQKILDAARDLFVLRGYHGVAINDIGAAVGITGPGIYRHFQSKADILATLVLEVAEAGYRSVLDAASTDPGDSQALAALVDVHIDHVLNNRALVSMWLREQRSLPPSLARKARRLEDRYRSVWLEVYSKERPDMLRNEAKMRLEAVGALIESVATDDSGLDSAHLKAVLRGMALSALRS